MIIKYIGYIVFFGSPLIYIIVFFTSEIIVKCTKIVARHIFNSERYQVTIANQEKFKMRSISKFVPFNSSIWKFLTFNTGLPLFDMGTDFRTFFFYLSVASFHPNWAMLTLGWILVSPEIAKMAEEGPK